MNNDKKEQRSVEEFIHFTLNTSVPPLYRIVEIGGVIVKHYPFIELHSKMLKEEFPTKEIEQKDYSLLSVHKNELEDQLELNREYCIHQYNAIKFNIRCWLWDKFENAGWPVFLNEPLDINGRKSEQLSIFGKQINRQLSNIFRGKEGEAIIRELKNPQFRQEVRITPGKHIKVLTRLPIVFKISELVGRIYKPLKNIDRVVSRSVDFYLQYVNIQSCLYEFDPEEVLAINKIHKRIEVFVQKFGAKRYSQQMIEDYLKEWERNKGLSHFRKTTVDELQSAYPEIGEISDSVIKHWEDQWKKFRDARTENE